MTAFILVKDPITQKIGCLIKSHEDSILEFPSIKEAHAKWQTIQFQIQDKNKKELFEKLFLCYFEPRVVESDIKFITNNIYDIQEIECPLYIMRNMVFWDKAGQALWGKSVPLDSKW